MAIVFNVDNICPMCGSYNHVLLFDGEVDGLERYTNKNKRVYFLKKLFLRLRQMSGSL